MNIICMSIYFHGHTCKHFVIVFSFLNRKNSSAAKIFESMTQEDFKHSIVVTKTSKMLAWLMVIGMNIYFVYFAMLRAITRSESWQYAYLMSCIAQLLVEVLVYETGECLWIHYFIPKLVSADIATTMNSVKQAINLAFQNKKVPAVLDSPKYFFVSHRLAEEFPKLFESSVVLAFHSYFPPSDLDATIAMHLQTETERDNTTRGFQLNEVRVRREKKRSTFVMFMQRFNVTVLVTVTLQLMGTVPIRMQQAIIRTVQPILFSFVIILGIYFVKYPVMVLLPMGFILYESVLYAHRSKNKIKRSIPAINDAEKNTSRVEACVLGTNDRNDEQDVSSIPSANNGRVVDAKCCRCGERGLVFGEYCYACGESQILASDNVGKDDVERSNSDDKNEDDGKDDDDNGVNDNDVDDKNDTRDAQNPKRVESNASDSGSDSESDYGNMVAKLILKYTPRYVSSDDDSSVDSDAVEEN